MLEPFIWHDTAKAHRPSLTMSDVQDDPVLAHIVAARMAVEYDSRGAGLESSKKKQKKRRDEHDCSALAGLTRSMVQFGTQPGEYTLSTEGNNTCYDAVCSPLILALALPRSVSPAHGVPCSVPCRATSITAHGHISQQQVMRRRAAWFQSLPM